MKTAGDAVFSTEPHVAWTFLLTSNIISSYVPGDGEQGDQHQQECDGGVPLSEVELGEHQLQQHRQQQGGGHQLCQGDQVPSIAWQQKAYI